MSTPATAPADQQVRDYDLIVIGAGSGGIGAAGIARTFGLSTLMIEAEARNVGGDCLNYGCVPSKALIHVSRLAHGAREAAKYGLEVGGQVDFAAALRHVHAAQDRIREHENAAYFDALEHQDVVIGWARFVGADTVEVDGQRYRGRRIVLATGSRPRSLDVPGVDQVEGLHTNHTFFATERPLPARFLVVGGGAIGCEMAQAMRRLGAEVTIVDRGDRLAAKELPEVSERLEAVFECEGIDILHRTEIVAFDGQVATVEHAGGRRGHLPFDEVLVAIGRDESVRDMNLDLAGVQTDERGVLRVDDAYATTNPQVFAVGDAMGREKFSHAAEMHNRDLIVNFLSPINKHHSLKHFSWVTYTDPEIATFGLQAAQLDEAGTAYETWRQPFTDDDRAIASGYADDALLVLYVGWQGITRERVILGGTMFAPGAGEMIQELVLMVQEGLGTGAIFDKVYAYPVASRINQKAVFEAREGGLGDVVKAGIRELWRAGA